MGPSTGSPLTSVYQQSGYAGYIVVYVLLGLLGLLMFYIIIPRGITAFLIKFRHDAYRRLSLCPNELILFYCLT